MSSDSDSDCSHISATPPRRQAPAPPRKPASIPSNKPKPRTGPPPAVATSSSSLQNPTPRRQHQSPRLPPPLISPLPYHIRQPGHAVVPEADCLPILLPGGRLSTSSSFSKIRRTSLDFDESDPVKNGLQNSETGSRNLSIGLELWEKDTVLKQASSVNAAKIMPNLIRGNSTVAPVKLQKCRNEGNFVKLNVNNCKRRFVSRNFKRKGSHSSGKMKFYKRSKKKSYGESHTQNEGLCVEDGLVTDTAKEKITANDERARFNEEIVEEAIMATRENPSETNLLRLLKLVYGYDSFREGQLEAIKLVIERQSAMVVLPTGSGKSLCYQIPTMVLPGLTLVVSPLVALMFDQMKQLPGVINGGILCSSQTLQEYDETTKMIREGSLKVLFVSPERFMSEEFLSLLSSSSTVSLVVVDEAHCISEWSHNFRPSYMRVRASLMRSRIDVDCILAMTATATRTTLNSVMSALEIPSDNLIEKTRPRENLQLSVSYSQNNRMKELLSLLRSAPYEEVRSIIIYCKFQYETDQISRYLCDNNINAKSYHSGMTPKDRCRIQELFSSNKIRAIVATVAFGMGLDKRDIGAIIHYSLPNSLEEYIQEIGRAGRDGRMSFCHLFYDDVTYFRLRSLMHSDGVDEYAVNKFLCQVFSSETNLQGKISSLVKESASRNFDMKEEVMLTLLTQLELGEVQYLQLLPTQNITCTLNFHQVQSLVAGKDMVVAVILKMSQVKQGQYVFDIPTVANTMGITTADVCNRLQLLKLKGDITYEMKDLAYCYTILEHPKDVCSLSAQMKKWLSEVGNCKVQKLDAMCNAVKFALDGCDKSQGCSGTNHTSCLQRKIVEYFERDCALDLPIQKSVSSTFLRADIKVFLQSNSHAKLTPRAVARIMHGIASPAYPSSTWAKTHFWGRYSHVDFHMVIEAAKAELMNFVGKGASLTARIEPF
ncbi:hypothetical protein MLD38_011876 [Melastoma candidum]|uniref:Uncharacterized protein n=1 Tax=Melastoma candidum TaxID=119954 RepID=A0ACB9R6B7_9MYRT|nr:hypothetical protein MLD38_011876 [Melastoma candidum]